MHDWLNSQEAYHTVYTVHTVRIDDTVLFIMISLDYIEADRQKVSSVCTVSIRMPAGTPACIVMTDTSALHLHTVPGTTTNFQLHVPTTST